MKTLDCGIVVEVDGREFLAEHVRLSCANVVGPVAIDLSASPSPQLLELETVQTNLHLAFLILFTTKAITLTYNQLTETIALGAGGGIAFVNYNGSVTTTTFVTATTGTRLTVLQGGA